MGLLGLILHTGVLPVHAVSTLANPTISTSEIGSLQRKVFYAAGRVWVFYLQNASMYVTWRSSTDGVVWSAEYSMTSELDFGASCLDTYFDGSNLHVAYANSSNLVYRRGAPQSDGSITWATVNPQKAGAYAPKGAVSITANSSGYPFISWYYSGGPNYYCYVVHSNTNDGTWVSASGFPYTASSSAGYSEMVNEGGNVTVFYTSSGAAATLKAQTYYYSGWTAEAHTTYKSKALGSYSVVAESTNVHVVFENDSTYQILYTLYDSNTNTFSAETVVNGTTTYSQSNPVLSEDITTSTLYCFWTNASDTFTGNHMYYKKYAGGAWDVAATDWLNEAAENFSISGCYSAIPTNGAGSFICVAYSTLVASPYNLKFATILLNSAPTIGIPTVTWDDTNNCYAQKKNYAVQVVYTDLNGYADINYAEMFIKTGGNVTRAEFAFCEDTHTFSIVSGSTDWELTGANVSTGNTITVTWNIKPHWAAAEESSLNFFFFANDTAGADSNSLNVANFDVVHTLVTTGLISNDSRTNVGGAVTLSGTVNYANDPGALPRARVILLMQSSLLLAFTIQPIPS